MAVTKGEPQAGLPRRAADHRTEIGKARTRAHPWPLLDRVAERKQAVAAGIRRANCTGVGGASRAANSAPVVRRMPCSIGVMQ